MRTSKSRQSVLSAMEQLRSEGTERFSVTEIARRIDLNDTAYQAKRAKWRRRLRRVGIQIPVHRSLAGAVPRLFPAVYWLQRNGYVGSEFVDGLNGKRRKVYWLISD